MPKKQELETRSVTTTVAKNGAGETITHMAVPDAQSSAAFSIDSKGNIKPDVKVYAADPMEAARQAVLVCEYLLQEAHRLQQLKMELGV